MKIVLSFFGQKERRFYQKRCFCTYQIVLIILSKACMRNKGYRGKSINHLAETETLTLGRLGQRQLQHNRVYLLFIYQLHYDVDYVEST